MKQTITFILAVVLFSACESEKEKVIRAEFTKIQAHWIINNFTFSANTPDSVKSVLKNGEMILRKCNYDDKRFNTDAVACGGDIEINKYLLSISYRYLYDKRLYVLAFAVYNGDATIQNRPDGPHQKISNLMNGVWDITATDNTLTAKQTQSLRGLPYLVSFTAVKK